MFCLFFNTPGHTVTYSYIVFITWVHISHNLVPNVLQMNRTKMLVFSGRAWTGQTFFLLRLLFVLSRKHSHIQNSSVVAQYGMVWGIVFFMSMCNIRTRKVTQKLMNYQQRNEQKNIHDDSMLNLCFCSLQNHRSKWTIQMSWWCKNAFDRMKKTKKKNIKQKNLFK